MTATLLVSGWRRRYRRSGAGRASPSAAAAGRRARPGRPAGRRPGSTAPLEVPPRSIMHRMPPCRRSSPRPPPHFRRGRTRCRSRAAGRAARTGRGRARPAGRPPGWPPPCRARAREAVSTRGTSPGHDHHAVVVGDDRVAGRDELPAQDDRDVDRPGGGLHRPLWADSATTRRGNPSRAARRRRAPRRPATTPRTPWRASEVANSSPNSPSVDGEVVVTTSTSPGRHVSTARGSSGCPRAGTAR